MRCFQLQLFEGGGVSVWGGLSLSGLPTGASWRYRGTTKNALTGRGVTPATIRAKLMCHSCLGMGDIISSQPQ